MALPCPACGVDNRSDRRFCGQCGAALARSCPACGAANEPDVRFCGQCGVGLEPDPGGSATPRSVATSAAAGPSVSDVTTPHTEVRVVSVLFVDLVGFTALSEGRDPELVRELLDRYFVRARRVAERYGGTVEKFIGDAVMAVWGTPVAHDDDAERAVRAAMDLLDEVAVLGDDEGLTELRARAGVATGRVAVAIGAEHQGMVAGDRVNTAARIQSAAPPGTVLVDDATRRASSTAIAYEDGGEHDLQGKDEVVRTWRATRVVARVGGAVQAQGLEPPFVGRQREFRLVRDVFESVAEQGSAAMVAVVGQAGIGKSRLAWEFEKHLDGLVQSVFWHRGRCLAYGEGVAYNALAEMVRARADIVEDEDHVTARRKLENNVAERLDDEDERAFVLPRLAQLLGLEDRVAPEQADLFAGWRLFLERLADTQPVVLVFEDVQWADQGLLDFIEHLLDWSRDRPILVLTLARPEIADRVDWAAQARNLTTIRLEPLGDDAMRELLAGLVPGLPEGFRDRIAEQAEGVPLYAVETVRVLLDRGQVVPGDDGYELAGEVDELEVPESLQALVAARLDGLEPDVRDLVQHASVLGHTFTRDGLRALSGCDDEVLDEGLHSLRARDFITVDTTARGPEDDRYAFMQSMVRTVAYDTLSRHEQKRRHLAAAAHLESLAGADELAEVIATHYLDAYRADPDGEDADEVRRDALRMLHRAADRAESLAATDEAQRCCERVAELTSDRGQRAAALLRAGDLAYRGGRMEEAETWLQQAAEAFAALDDTRSQALAEAMLARIGFDQGRGDEAMRELGDALTRLDPEETPAEFARLATELGRQLYFAGHVDEAREQIEAALRPAERERLLDVLCDALNTKGLMHWHDSQSEEGMALLRHAYLISDEVPAYVASRAANNFTVLLSFRCMWDEVRRVAERALRRAQRDGDRFGEQSMLARLADVAQYNGHLDDALAQLEQAEETAELTRFGRGFLDGTRTFVLVRMGDLERARELVDSYFAQGFGNEQEHLLFRLQHVQLLSREGDHRGAVEEALAVSEAPTTQATVAARLEDAVASAIAIGDVEVAAQLLERMRRLAEPADAFSQAGIVISEARLAAARGEPDAEERFRRAVVTYDRLGVHIEGAVARIALAEWLVNHGRMAEARPLLDRSEDVLEEVGAGYWPECIAAIRERDPALARERPAESVEAAPAT